MPRFVRRQRERQAHPNWVAGFDRNRWPTSVGTGGRIASESVAGLARITQAGPGVRAGECGKLVLILAAFGPSDGKVSGATLAQKYVSTRRERPTNCADCR